MSKWMMALAVVGLLTPALEAQGSARYELTFTSTWSQATHPIDWTSFAHYSRLVFGTHDANAEFWRPGGMASPGVRQIAETGNWGLFQGEVQAEIANGNADQFQTLAAMGKARSLVRLRNEIVLSADTAHHLSILQRVRGNFACCGNGAGRRDCLRGNRCNRNEKSRDITRHSRCCVRNNSGNY